MPSLLTYHPFKAIWTLLAVTFNVARFPLWIIYAIVPAFRQNPKWTFRQSVRVRIVRAFVYNTAVVEAKTPLSLKPGREGKRFITMNPGKRSLYTGVVDKDPEIQPTTIGATWYPNKLEESEKGSATVVLHFHGGAYAIGDGREHDAGFLARTLAAETPATHVLCPQYRLSSNAGCRFPSQLQDAITSLSYLVHDLGLAPHQILISGDSAGANLCLGLLRYLSDNPKVDLPNPVCCWLWSPWVHPANAAAGQTFDHSPNYPLDYITKIFGEWGANTLKPAASSGVTIEDAAISFLGQPFPTKTPLYISTGECEVLFHDDVQLAEEMRAVKGNKVKLQIEDKAVHDIILVGKLTGFVAEAKLAARRAGTYYASLSKA